MSTTMSTSVKSLHVEDEDMDDDPQIQAAPSTQLSSSPTNQSFQKQQRRDGAHDHSDNLDVLYPPPGAGSESAASAFPPGASASSSIPVADFLEGGWGWVVVFACAYLSFWFIGFQYTWGIFQLKLVQQGLSDDATLAFVGSLGITFVAILAIPNASLIKYFGARRLSLTSVVLLGGGAIFSSWACTSLVGLFITYGTIMGIAMSFNYMVVSSVPSQYFSRKKGLATGIVMAGGGLGGAVLGPGIEALQERVGVAGTFRIMGGIVLVTGLPTALLIKEVRPRTTGGMINFQLFKDPKFLLLFLVGAIGTFPLFVPAFFLPSYASTIGLSTATGAGMVACYNLSSAMGRIMFGYMCDTLGALNALALTLALSGSSMLAIWPVSNSLTPLIIFCIINGASNGGFFAVVPVVVGSIYGLQQLPVALGMTVTGWMGGYLLGAPIAGYLLNAFGGPERGLQAFRPAMYYGGAISLVALCLVLGVRALMGKPGWARV